MNAGMMGEISRFEMSLWQLISGSMGGMPSSISSLSDGVSKPPFPNWVPPWLTDNPLFSAGFGLFGLGFAASLLRGVSGRSMRLAERRMLTTLEIPSKDHSYQWVMQWLVAKCVQMASMIC